MNWDKCSHFQAVTVPSAQAGRNITIGMHKRHEKCLLQSLLIPPIVLYNIFWLLHMQTHHNIFSSVGVLTKPRLPSVLILWYHAFWAFTTHAAADSALLGFYVLCLIGSEDSTEEWRYCRRWPPQKSHKKELNWAVAGGKLQGGTICNSKAN